MAVPKANQRAVNKYVKANYDRINVTMPKGEKEVIQGCAVNHGESVNGFIVRAIRERMVRDSGGTAPGAAPVEQVLAEMPSERPQKVAESTSRGWVVSSLPSETLKVAQRASEVAGEALPDFIRRAVETQAQRDRSSLAMGINPATGGKLEKEA